MEESMYQRILVAVDGSAPSSHALHEAVQLAAALHAQVRLVYVVDIQSLYGIGLAGIDIPTIEQAWCEEGRKILAESEAVARAAGIAVDTALRETDGGRVGDAIAAEAKAWPADLIVAGTHGRHGIGHLLLGSVAEGIARGAPVPVLLVRGPLPQPPA
jgi:nucleotide-binding universal stress UspA family protein